MDSASEAPMVTAGPLPTIPPLEQVPVSMKHNYSHPSSAGVMGASPHSDPDTLSTSTKSESSVTQFLYEGKKNNKFDLNTCSWQNNIVERKLDALI